jgi:hypothetical protein
MHDLNTSNTNMQDYGYAPTGYSDGLQPQQTPGTDFDTTQSWNDLEIKQTPGTVRQDEVLPNYSALVSEVSSSHPMAQVELPAGVPNNVPRANNNAPPRRSWNQRNQQEEQNLKLVRNPQFTQHNQGSNVQQREVKNSRQGRGKARSRGSRDRSRSRERQKTPERKNNAKSNKQTKPVVREKTKAKSSNDTPVDPLSKLPHATKFRQDLIFAFVKETTKRCNNAVKSLKCGIDVSDYPEFIIKILCETKGFKYIQELDHMCFCEFCYLQSLVSKANAIDEELKRLRSLNSDTEEEEEEEGEEDSEN